MAYATVVGSPSYRWGAMALFLATAAILGALAFEHIGGYKPCPLCLQQRWAYYGGIPALYLALVLLSMEWRRTASLVFFAVALAFLANAGLGVYHAGAEWKLWPGPETCAAAGAQITTDAGSLLGRLGTTVVIRCDEAALRVAGLSFAGWNVLVCLGIFTGAIGAAFSAGEPPEDL